VTNAHDEMLVSSPKTIRTEFHSGEGCKEGLRLTVDRLCDQIMSEFELRDDGGRAQKEMYWHKTVRDSFECYGISAPEFAEITKSFATA